MAEALAFIHRDMLIARRYPSTLFMPFFSAIVSVATFAYMSRLVSHSALEQGGRTVPYLTYVVINLAFMLLLSTALNSLSTNIRRDQLTGTLQAMFATGARNSTIALGSMLWPLAFGILQAMFYFVVGVAFGMRVHGSNLPMLILFAVLGTAYMGMLGVMAAAVVIQFKQSPPSSLLVGSGAALLAGVLFPVKLLPLPLQIISWLLPMTHALNGFRGAVLGLPAQAVWPDALWLALATAVLTPIALLWFTRAVEVAKFDGTLASY
jgi:ABC-2 type transport system permease protein